MFPSNIENLLHDHLLYLIFLRNRNHIAGHNCGAAIIIPAVPLFIAADVFSTDNLPKPLSLP